LKTKTEFFFFLENLDNAVQHLLQVYNVVTAFFKIMRR